MNSPAVELLKYMDMTLEKEKQEDEKKQIEMWINYLSNVFSQPAYGKPDKKFLKAKKEFEDMLMPKQPKKPKLKKVYKWDFEE
ncbi:hypothetical protein [Virgibacillus alimentarius]|uniref:hypothetical protein n=1 Tax=Virgibacillus alimentarius TaxID=698769 RepID=UPI0004932F62|nr:hypothetical protein [Virgibacillus alimentarius]